MKLAVLDLETDPFAPGEMIHPFVAGFYDGSVFKPFWGNGSCIHDSCEYLAARKEPMIIYAHNGGKFDWFFYLEHFNGGLKIVNNRIIQANLYHHQVRDSFAIMPFPLAQYHKDKIDYQKMRADRREEHKDEIIGYLASDCRYLFELVTEFHKEFGNRLTIGGTSMKELKKIHQFSCGSEKFDEKIRTKFYYGGRNQCFEGGIIHAPPGCQIEVWDVNSMYPYVMASTIHPIGTGIIVGRKITDKTCFVLAEGINNGAFPTRTKTGGLDFTQPAGTFGVTIHEWRAALDTGTFRPTRIIKTYDFQSRITFDEFVDHFFDARKKAKAQGDFIRTLFYKFVLNSAYGKFAQNPENYHEFQITGMIALDPPWEPAFIHQGKWIIWKKPSERRSYYNIATGASITGASRALLLRGLSGATRPLYCDTDSIICLQLEARKSDTELGAWKLECSGDFIAIAGKKLYAVFGFKKPEGSEEVESIKLPNGSRAYCLKKACKGVRLTAAEIYRVAKGETVTYANPVPSFKWDGSHRFITRNIKSTVKG